MRGLKVRILREPPAPFAGWVGRVDRHADDRADAYVVFPGSTTAYGFRQDELILTDESVRASASEGSCR